MQSLPTAKDKHDTYRMQDKHIQDKHDIILMAIGNRARNRPGGFCVMNFSLKSYIYQGM